MSALTQFIDCDEFNICIRAHFLGQSLSVYGSHFSTFLLSDSLWRNVMGT